jgi:hypothetical protein
MAAAGRDATDKVRSMLAGATGLPMAISALAERERVALPALAASQVIAQQVTFETAERSSGVQYPVVYVYCEGVANLLKEKFRTLSGKAYMAVEVRASHDRLEEVTEKLQLYAAAAMEVLDANRGDWGDGMFYSGAYKAEYGPVQRGGKSFLAAAKIRFEVDVSR